MTPSQPIESFEFRNPSGPAGYQQFSVDWAAGLIRGVGEGFWSMELTTRHFARWVDCVRTIQRSGKPVRILADLRRSQVQSQEVADFLKRGTAGLYASDDRIAMLVSNSLAKAQLRRVLQDDIYQYFISIEAAAQWLDAFAPGARAA